MDENLKMAMDENLKKAAELGRKRANVLESAKPWASQGLKVAPIHSDKRRASFIHAYASTAEDVEELFKRGCGHGFEGFIMCVGDDILALDLDRHGTEDGVAVFEAYCREHNYTPNTYTEATPRDGRHLFFKRPKDCPPMAPNNGADRVLPSVDTMTGAAGRLIMAPSFREDGEYTVINNVPMEVAPPCIVALFKERVDDEPDKVELGDPDPNNRYVRSALANTVAKIAQLQEGNRNAGLFTNAASIYRYVAGGELTDEEVTEALTNAALSIGLEENEIAATLSSARTRGMNNPRQAPKKSEEYSEAYSEEYEVIDPERIPLSIFPPKTARFIKAVARSTGGDPNIVAACVLSEVGIQIGRAHMVEVTNTWQEGANTYTCIVAKSGEGKTPIEKLVSAPRIALEAAFREEYEKEMAAYKKEMAEYTKAQKKGGGEYEGDEPVKPRLTRYTMDDFTMETLPRNLKDNPKGIGINKDEFKALFIQGTKYSAKGDNGLIQALISGYNYAPLTVDRVDEEKNIFIPCSCFSLRGLIQPSVLYSTISKEDMQSGFASRFSFIYGDRQRLVSLYDGDVSPECMKDWEDIIIKLASIDLVPGSNERPKFIHLTDNAKMRLEETFLSIGIEKARETSDLLQSFYSKLPEKIIRYANVLHHLHMAENSSVPDWFTDVSVEVVEKAITLGTWVKRHFLRFVEEYAAAQEERGKKDGNKDNKPKPVRITTLQQCIDEILSENRKDIEANGGTISHKLLKQKLSERYGKSVQTKDYDEYLTSLGSVRVQNVRTPGSKRRGRGIKISKQVFERVSGVSPFQNAVTPSALTNSAGNTPETPRTAVSPAASNVSMPAEYIV